MVYIVIKKIKGKEYLYLVRSVRKGAKIVQETVKYIGQKRPVRKEELECMKLSYEGKDWILNELSDKLSYLDHKTLKDQSINQKEYLESLDIISKEKYKENFLSLFIANSNSIEGSTLTIKETFKYLFGDITPKGHNKKELFMASNLLNAWEYVEKNCKKLPKKEDLLELHKLVNNNIEVYSTLGKYKKVQNYIGDVKTSSYLFVEDKMDKLLKWIKKAYIEINDFEVAFQSHAQFEIIHPFVDGNGRVGRLLINWLLMYKNNSPLVIKSRNRYNYISALNSSRRGKIEAICVFCKDEYLDFYKFVV